MLGVTEPSQKKKQNKKTKTDFLATVIMSQTIRLM